MSHLENKLEWCIKKAEKEGIKHRGLKEIDPNIEKAKKHLDKAENNLKAMLYFLKGNFTDWAVSACFYSMYHCLLGILAKQGYESRNQECTFIAVEHLIKNKKIDLDIKWIRKIASMEAKQADGKDVSTLREEFQYGTDAVLDEPKIQELVKEAKEFIEIVKEIVISE